MIDPVKVEVSVNIPPAEAFEAFTRDVAKWWPRETHSLAAEKGQVPDLIVIEPHESGLIYEVGKDGTRGLWGKVTVWEPGRRLSFDWHVGRSPDLSTFVDVTFARSDKNGTLVTLEHRNWEVLGEEGQKNRDGYASGWLANLSENFVPFANG